MRWFEGSITHAVQLSKTRNAVFVVYIEGDDDNSKGMTDMIDDGDVSEKLESKSFVSIKVSAGTETYTQFVQIYQLVPVPSLFFIGKNGTPLEVIPQKLEKPEILSKIDSVIKRADVQPFALFGAPSTSEKKDLKKESASLINQESSQPEAVVQPSTSMDSLKQETEVAGNEPENDSNTSELTKEERIEHAKKLIEEKREAKRLEEEQKDKQKEIERRKMGQEMQKMRQQQHDQELKQLMEDRQREKNEQLAARQKVLAQIAQDKAERAQKFKIDGSEHSTPSPSMEHVPPSRSVNRDNHLARLQFRLADGTNYTHDFDGQNTLQVVRNYVLNNLNLPYHNFALSTTFPRRQFTENDNSQTLADLELVPNAVILILPSTVNTVVPSSSGGITGFLWLLLTPFINLFSYIRGFFGGANQGNASQGSKRTLDQSGNSNPGSTTSGPKRRAPESTVVRRQGNVYRLADRDKDSDDENNTWNGNSTQQM